MSNKVKEQFQILSNLINQYADFINHNPDAVPSEHIVDYFFLSYLDSLTSSDIGKNFVTPPKKNDNKVNPTNIIYFLKNTPPFGEITDKEKKFLSKADLKFIEEHGGKYALLKQRESEIIRNARSNDENEWTLHHKQAYISKCNRIKKDIEKVKADHDLKKNTVPTEEVSSLLRNAIESAQPKKPSPTKKAKKTIKKKNTPLSKEVDYLLSLVDETIVKDQETHVSK